MGLHIVKPERNLFVRMQIVPMCLLFISASCVREPAWAQQDNPKITISKETTYFTQPLNEHGEVDYWKALNAHYSKGVTPENNLVTAIVELCGVDIENEIVRTRYVERLGIEDLPSKQGYLIEFEEFANERIDEDEAYEISEQILTSPWSRQKYPLVGDWIDEYSPVVDNYIDQLEKKTNYYDPLAAENELNEPAMAPRYALMRVRLITRFLTARSLLKLHNDDLNGCMSDLLAIRKTSHLLCTTSSLIELVTGYALAGICHDAEVRFCNHKLTTVMHLKRYRHDIAKYTLKNCVPEAIRVDQRILLLEVAKQVKDGNKGIIELLNFRFQLEKGVYYKRTHELVIRSVRRFVDWNQVNKAVNMHVEQSASVFEQGTELDCLIAASLLDEQLESQFEYQESIDFLRVLLMSKAVAKSDLLSDVINSSFRILDVSHQVFESYCDKKANERLLDTCIALYLFRHERDEFPGELNELVPHYCKALPIDPFTNEPMIYKKRKEHFLLYSVGRDREDNGGIVVAYQQTDIAVTSNMQVWDHRYDD